MQQQSRINNPQSLDLEYIDNEIREGNHVIVQFSEDIYPDDKLFTINGLCEKYDKSFGVRFYGHYSNVFNCSVLLKIPDVKCLYVDCLLNADNLLLLNQLNKLEKLCLGVYELAETEILNNENLKQLTELIITETKTKSLNLEYLKDYKKLKLLILGGHTKNISTIGNLEGLEFLSLNSIKKTSIGFINKIKKLKTLRLILGGRENIHEIESNEIENLEIVWVRGFNDISNIAKFKKLQYLKLEDNIKLEKIEFEEDLPCLKILSITNCKTLYSLKGLYNLTSLERIGIYQTNIDFDTFIKQDLPTSLKAVRFYTSKSKLNDAIKIRIKERGYTD